MARGLTEQVRSEIDALRRRLDSWRSSSDRGRQIPEDIRREAVELARAHGVSPVANALGLNYEGVKRRVRKQAQADSPAFVELEVRQPQREECVLEFENRRGTKMTLRFSHPDAIDLLALANAFLERNR